ncbi:hypothetical protein Gohar_003228 [Gossypium harknessii]|uniref:Methyltransferase n=1 Tax=Gossypium harknessii TaxID=34285 RepID=A0A7J9HPJ3_9ROSI|nr:hypothetical protein [Gossypium harknessii]
MQNAGGKPLLELNRVLKPGGYFIWSATPVYRDDERDSKVWKCENAALSYFSWGKYKIVFPSLDFPCLLVLSLYEPLSYCISRLPVDRMGNLLRWSTPWPQRLSSKPPSLPSEPDAEDIFIEDTKHWAALVSEVYLDGLAISLGRIRNVMDMNAGYGGFAAALIDQPLWVMNVVPIDAQDTLSIIFERGLIGVYHDWCESFNTYPRTYDLLHASFLFKNLKERCDIIDLAVEMDRILRPGGYLLVQDTMENIKKLNPVLRSLHWSTTLYQGQFLVGEKGFWRPSENDNRKET